MVIIEPRLTCAHTSFLKFQFKLSGDLPGIGCWGQVCSENGDWGLTLLTELGRISILKKAGEKGRHLRQVSKHLCEGIFVASSFTNYSP